MENANPTGPKNSASTGRDTVELSAAAKMAAKIQDGSVVRTDLVERVRNEIDAGTYETPERIDATVDRLMEEILSDIL